MDVEDVSPRLRLVIAHEKCFGKEWVDEMGKLFRKGRDRRRVAERNNDVGSKDLDNTSGLMCPDYDFI